MSVLSGNQGINKKDNWIASGVDVNHFLQFNKFQHNHSYQSFMNYTEIFPSADARLIAYGKFAVVNIF